MAERLLFLFFTTELDSVRDSYAGRNDTGIIFYGEPVNNTWQLYPTVWRYTITDQQAYFLCVPNANQKPGDTQFSIRSLIVHLLGIVWVIFFLSFPVDWNSILVGGLVFLKKVTNFWQCKTNNKTFIILSERLPVDYGHVWWGVLGLASNYACVLPTSANKLILPGTL